jgi:hypothetical protein
MWVKTLNGARVETLKQAWLTSTPETQVESPKTGLVQTPPLLHSPQKKKLRIAE